MQDDLLATLVQLIAPPEVPAALPGEGREGEGITLTIPHHGHDIQGLVAVDVCQNRRAPGRGRVQVTQENRQPDGQEHDDQEARERRQQPAGLAPLCRHLRRRGVGRARRQRLGALEDTRPPLDHGEGATVGAPDLPGLGPGLKRSVTLRTLHSDTFHDHSFQRRLPPRLTRGIE